jgi:hypothetical protein
LLGLLASAAAQIAVPEGAALTAAIAARDSAFFALFFEGCDAAKARTMLTDDFEIYHDKAGLVARSGDEFAAQYARACEERKTPDAWRSRRELVAGSLEVWPVPGWGAIEQGEHLFYERRGSGPEKLAGRARFTQAWALGADGQWRLARVFSYAHGPAE